MTDAFGEYAAYHFMLAAPEADGQPLYEHLNKVWKQTGKMPETLANAPDMPAGLDYLWRVFAELHGARGTTGWGPARIGFHDIDGYQRVTGLRLAGWERACIRAADNAYLDDYAARQPRRDQ